MLHGIVHIVWNLFLAGVAIGLGLAIPSLARMHAERRDHLLTPLLATVVVLWLLFLPNTCYLFTELRHLFEAIDEGDLWTRARGDGHAKLWLAIRLSVAAMYVGAGALSFGVAIKPVRALAEQRGFRTRRWLPAFFVVVALGVYLGLVLRFNSWDALSHPERVVSAVVTTATRRTLTLLIGGLGLWAVYEVVDVWLDGALARWSRRGRA